LAIFIDPSAPARTQSDPEDIARFLHSANNSLGKEQLGILLAEKYSRRTSLGTEPAGQVLT
jgi:hypothetical protein